MSDSRSDFESRLRMLSRRHRAFRHGTTTKMRKDGLIIVRPVRRKAREGVSLTGFALALLVVMAFKGFLIASTPSDVYAGHLERLAAGTFFEQLGSFLMQPEPVSLGFADLWVLVRGA